MAELRNLVIVLGDQLDLQSSAYDGFDPQLDAVWMAEVSEESTHVWSSKPRIAVFIAAMRHFAEALRAAGRPLHYKQLDDTLDHGSLAAELQTTIESLKPGHLIMTAPGDWRVWQSIKSVAKGSGLSLEVRDDRHFYSTVRDFAAHAHGRKTLRLEYFYRELRQKHGVLMQDGQPVGGQWNFGSSGNRVGDFR